MQKSINALRYLLHTVRSLGERLSDGLLQPGLLRSYHGARRGSPFFRIASCNHKPDNPRASHMELGQSSPNDSLPPSLRYMRVRLSASARYKSLISSGNPGVWDIRYFRWTWSITRPRRTDMSSLLSVSSVVIWMRLPVDCGFCADKHFHESCLISPDGENDATVTEF